MTIPRGSHLFPLAAVMALKAEVPIVAGPARALAERLRPKAVRVTALVPAHSGTLNGLDPLLGFRDGHLPSCGGRR